MISVTSSLVTKTETVGTMIDMETDVRATAGQQIGRRNEIRREIDALIIDITKAMGMLMMRDITTITEVMVIERGTETGTMSTLTE